jgi:hypothetical protein
LIERYGRKIFGNLNPDVPMSVPPGGFLEGNANRVLDIGELKRKIHGLRLKLGHIQQIRNQVIEPVGLSERACHQRLAERAIQMVAIFFEAV